MDIITAPWDAVTVARLNAFQRRGGMHPFTCGNDTRDELVAHLDGWHCPNCDYTQDWAHSFMVDIGMKHTTVLEYSEALRELDWPEPEPFVHLDGCIGGPIMQAFDGSRSCMWCQPCNMAWNAALAAAQHEVSETFWPSDGSWVTDQTTFDNLGKACIRKIAALGGER